MDKPLKVLMIEDSDSDAALILRELTKQGYIPISERVDTAQDMIKALEKHSWDIVIADYVLPGFSGLGALKILQETRMDIPCIITSGRISEETAVAAMKAGAKDYVMKDNLKRLGPAVERELKEAEERRKGRKIEENFRQNEIKLGAVLERLPCILWTTDSNLIVTSLMGAGLNVFSCKPDEFKDKPVSEVSILNGSILALNAQSRALEGKPSTFELLSQGRVLYCFVEPLYDAMGIISGVFGLALDMTDKRHAELELRSLSRKLVATQEIERRNIARELHDQIGQSLTVLKLMLGQARRLSDDKANTVLSEAQVVTSELIQQVREMSLNLRPSMLDDLGLLPTLLWHFEKFSKQSNIRINFEHSGLGVTLPPEINTAAYRIIQEALTNVARYAKVSEATVTVKVEEESLYVEVEDKGIGFDPTKLNMSSSAGISGMRERVRLLNGKLFVYAQPGEGAKITVEIPIPSTSSSLSQ